MDAYALHDNFSALCFIGIPTPAGEAVPNTTAIDAQDPLDCEKDAVQTPDTGKAYSAMERFMSTQELFEMPLKYFGPATLPRLRRVCKHWRRTIEGSSMRKTLFLEAETGKTNKNTDSQARTWTHNDAILKEPQLVIRYTKAPLDEFRMNFIEDPDQVHPKDIRLKMFLTQPPCTDLEVCIISRDRATPAACFKTLGRAYPGERHLGYLKGKVHNDDGITLGDVVGKFRRRVGDQFEWQSLGDWVLAHLCLPTPKASSEDEQKKE